MERQWDSVMAIYFCNPVAPWDAVPTISPPFRSYVWPDATPGRDPLMGHDCDYTEFQDMLVENTSSELEHLDDFLIKCGVVPPPLQVAPYSPLNKKWLRIKPQDIVVPYESTLKPFAREDPPFTIAYLQTAKLPHDPPYFNVSPPWTCTLTRNEIAIMLLTVGGYVMLTP